MVWQRQRVYMQELPWCTTFIHAVFDRPDVLGRAHPGSRVLYRRMRRKGLLRGRDYTPQKNDLVFLSTRTDGRVSHCGIVESADETQVTSIDGNTVDPTGFFEPAQGGAVARRVRKRTDPVIVCYASTGAALTQDRGEYKNTEAETMRWRDILSFSVLILLWLLLMSLLWLDAPRM
jgi:hypothetical protein